VVRGYPATVFVVLAFAITWSVWVPRALVSHGLLTARWPIALGAYWTYGPAVAAVITAGLVGRDALRELGARLIRWRVRWWWYAIVLLGPAAFWGVVYAVASLLGLSSQLRQPPLVEQGLAAAVPLFLVLALTDGLGEEPGWRGFVLPRQLEHFTRLVASCLLGVIWAVWHLPLFWTQGATFAGSSPLLLVLELPAVSIVYTWVFEHTNGSVLIAILLHAALNLCAVSTSVGGAASWQLITLLLVSKWLVAGAVVVTWVRQPRRAVIVDQRPGSPN
jgi:membrane protease YdiL (CAAX protease family)